MTILAINKLWSFLQSLSLTAQNERWLAERLLESANLKSTPKENETSNSLWKDYVLSEDIMNLSLKNRQEVSDDITGSLYSALEEKYR